MPGSKQPREVIVQSKIRPSSSDIFINIKTAIKNERTDILDDLLAVGELPSRFWYSVLYEVMKIDNVDLMRVLMKYGIKKRDNLCFAVACGLRKISMYLINHNDDGFFALYDWWNFSILYYMSLHREFSASDFEFVIKKYPEMLWQESGLQQEPELTNVINSVNLDILDQRLKFSRASVFTGAAWGANSGAMKVLRRYQYIDVNYVWPQLYIPDDSCMEDKLRLILSGRIIRVYDMSYRQIDTLHAYVKLLVAYGANIYEKKYTNVDNTKGTVREILVHHNVDLIPVYDLAVEEGREIWEWNQWVMREVVKWSGCVVMGYGGSSGGDGVGTSRGMCSVVGIGKRAVEALVQFAPAQFDEKLELGTVRVLRAQAMLETGHGVVFGDVHNGGYVKYAGGTTVTCDYHIDVRMHAIGTRLQMDVRMKTWEDAKIQHNMGHNVSEVGKGQHSVSMMRVVWIGGDSYMDHGIANLSRTALYMRALQEIWTCGEEHLQQNENGMKQCMYVLKGAKMPDVHLLQSDGCGVKLHVWGGDAYDQKLHAQQQWYTETGHVLQTLAGVLHEEDMPHASQQLQHMAEGYAHNEHNLWYNITEHTGTADRLNTMQQAPELMQEERLPAVEDTQHHAPTVQSQHAQRITPYSTHIPLHCPYITHDMQQHIVYETHGMQPYIAEHHIVDFLHSFSLL